MSDPHKNFPNGSDSDPDAHSDPQRRFQWIDILWPGGFINFNQIDKVSEREIQTKQIIYKAAIHTISFPIFKVYSLIKTSRLLENETEFICWMLLCSKGNLQRFSYIFNIWPIYMYLWKTINNK